MAASSFDPYGGVPSLQEALTSFVNGARELSISRAINDAQDQVQQIKSSGLADAKQRGQLNQVAQGLVAHMTASGASAASVANIYSSMNPPMPATPAAAIIQGAVTGNQELVDAGTKAQDLDFGSMAKKLGLQAQIAESSQNRLFDHQLDMMDLKNQAAQKQKLKQLTQGELDKVQAFDSAKMSLSGLADSVQANPNLVGPVYGRIPGRASVDPDFAAFKAQAEEMFNVYRKEITGAGASMGELKMLRASKPTIEDTPEAFMAKTKRSLDLGERIRARYMTNLGAAGRDMSGFQSVAPVDGPGESTPALQSTTGIPGLYKRQ